MSQHTRKGYLLRRRPAEAQTKKQGSFLCDHLRIVIEAVFSSSRIVCRQSLVKKLEKMCHQQTENSYEVLDRTHACSDVTYDVVNDQLGT